VARGGGGAQWIALWYIWEALSCLCSVTSDAFAGVVAREQRKHTTDMIACAVCSTVGMPHALLKEPASAVRWQQHALYTTALIRWSQATQSSFFSSTLLTLK